MLRCQNLSRFFQTTALQKQLQEVRFASLLMLLEAEMLSLKREHGGKLLSLLQHIIAKLVNLLNDTT